MTLGRRKLAVLVAVGLVFLLANLFVVTSWLAEHGVLEWATQFRAEFLIYRSYCTSLPESC